MADRPQAVRCGSYWPGHHVHWIQAKKVFYEPGALEPATVVGLETDTVVIVEVGGELRRYFNHTAPGIEHIAERYDRRAVLVPRWRVLVIPGPATGLAFELDGSRSIGPTGESFLFYLAREADWKPCLL